METFLILIASVAMLAGPTLLVRNDPDDDGQPASDPLGKYRHLDLYSH